MKWALWFVAFITIEVAANEPLRIAVSQTPYSAVLQLTSFEEVEQGGDAYYKIQAEVLEDIRGNSSSHIYFNMHAEMGDEPNLDTAPVIITLCHDEQGFFWPSTGSEFMASKQNVSIAKDVAEHLNVKQISFSHCPQ
ncbi:hypothetical protein GCM10007906_08000 [Vibrio hyugaensis]|uniref:Uncharacterized protein n=1 Tax=Vibrio hyugaensis TaxID=1534743 RepID=A0ABQ5XX18_9VIBR|nr:hypothetical protein [Vibrio hyugaensis]GLR03213.1 hypothetical protein GCM10007906_08000 [Vibrio hyugaensis]